MFPPSDDIFQYGDMLRGPGNMWAQFLWNSTRAPIQAESSFFLKGSWVPPMRELPMSLYPGYIAFFNRKRTLKHRWIMFCAGEVKSSSKDRLKLLDITLLANIRADGHPNSYREFQPFGKDHKKPIQNDCLHWCLPGPIDTWNDLLVESLHNEIYRWQNSLALQPESFRGLFKDELANWNHPTPWNYRLPFRN